MNPARPYPEYDTDEWRELRDQKLREWVGDPNALAFILDFSDACELFDDVVDKDKDIPESHAVRVLFNLLTELPLNPWWDAHKGALIPVIITGINAWLDANEMEKGTPEQQVFSFVLRDWYCELIGLVIYLTRGRDYMRQVSMEIRHFFTHHETLDEYRRALK